MPLHKNWAATITSVESDATSWVKTHMKVPKDKSALQILAEEG
jgi:hypothetical protein